MEGIIFLAFILEVSGSNLNRKTDYPYSGFSHISYILQANATLVLLLGTQDTQCTAVLCSDIMVLEYTQDEYCNMHGSSHCIIPVVVMRMLMSFDDLRTFSVRVE